jgi:hypothetical protein
MGEVCWIDTGVGPPANPVCDAKGNIISLTNATDEEGILSAVGTGATVTSALSDWDLRIESEDVIRRIEMSAFSSV